MAKGWISAFERMDIGRYGGGAPLVGGVCSQDRGSIPNVPAAYPSDPQMTVGANTRYVVVAVEGAPLVCIYAGPPEASAAQRQARALVVPANAWGAYVEPGDVVHVWLAA